MDEKQTHDPIRVNWDNPAYAGSLRNGWNIERGVRSETDPDWIVDRFSCAAIEVSIDINPGMTPAQLYSVAHVFQVGQARGLGIGERSKVNLFREALGMEPLS